MVVTLPGLTRVLTGKNATQGSSLLRPKIYDGTTDVVTEGSSMIMGSLRWSLMEAARLVIEKTATSIFSSSLLQL